MDPNEVIEKIKKIMSILPPDTSSIIDDNKYDGAIYYIQHIPDDVEKSQELFINLCSEVIGTPKGPVNRQGIIGRFIDDSGNKPLKSIWHRFSCIDDKYREWTQPYFAISRLDRKRITYGKEKCLNKINSFLIEFYRDKKIDLLV